MTWVACCRACGCGWVGDAPLSLPQVRCNALMVERYFSVEEVCKAAGQLRTVIPSVLARCVCAAQLTYDVSWCTA